jgi:hypothetical protein
MPVENFARSFIPSTAAVALSARTERPATPVIIDDDGVLKDNRKLGADPK